MTMLQALILGVVEGLTEFLPVSSTGHMVMAGRLMQLPATDFVKTFEIVIQLGAILAVLAVSWKRLLLDRQVFIRVAAAFVPTAVIGLLFYKTIKTFLLGNALITAAALFFGGVFLILFERWQPMRVPGREELARMPIAHAATIGIVQAAAVVPGVSRSAATVVGGLSLGWSRPAIVEFSFLLAVPTIAAASGLDLLKSGLAFSGRECVLLSVGLLSAFFSALAVIRWFLRYVRTHTLTAFGVYRIAAALAFWFFVIR